MNTALERNLTHSMEICVTTMQTFYPTLGNQARRVCQLCKAIGEVLELKVEDRRVLESSALLVRHRTDRRAAPDHQTLAGRSEIAWPGGKGRDEQHPILGQELAVFGQQLEHVGEIIRAHHERYDGSGYPDQLVQRGIPWLARLLAVAVAYASSPLMDAEAVEKIKAGSGTAFDPEAVRAFLRAHAVAVIPRKERQVMLSDLRPGMVLAKAFTLTTACCSSPKASN